MEKSRKRSVQVLALAALPIVLFSAMIYLFSGTDTRTYASAHTEAAKPYDDLRSAPFGGIPAPYTVAAQLFDQDMLTTYHFDDHTVFEGSEDLAAQILKKGKNPGLGVRSLHERGITGAGVNVAIIDQNLLLDHPEFAGKIAAYHDTGCGQPASHGSMHAPSVASLLVGEACGVAPGAALYFAAAPSWTGDSRYYADALSWIIKENASLPQGEKIRVVSVSAAPSSEGSPFTKNLDQWDIAVAAAQEAGILVLDCRADETTGFLSPAFYTGDDPEDVTAYVLGFPSTYSGGNLPGRYVGVPCSRRTTALEDREDHPYYVYWGQGGLSWGIPFGAGVLALGWQVDPTLSSEEIVELLRETCYINALGHRIINPVAFIEAIEAQLQ